MKKINYVGVALMLIVISIFVIPITNAQTDPTIQDQSQTGTTNNPGTTTSDDDGFNWAWLLPLLLAIPVIYYLTRKTDDRNESRYAGVKGGRSIKESSDEY